MFIVFFITLPSANQPFHQTCTVDDPSPYYGQKDTGGIIFQRLVGIIVLRITGDTDIAQMIVHIIVIGIIPLGIYTNIIGTNIPFGELNHKYFGPTTIPATIHVMTVPFISGDIVGTIPVIN